MNNTKNKRRILLKVFLPLFLVFILSLTVFAIYTDKKINKEMDLNLIRTGASSVSKIYYFDFIDREKRVGEAVELNSEQIFLDKSEWCSIYSLPQTLIDSFVVVEDHRFYEHKGVDWLRTSKAFLNYIFKFDKSGYGGSTITQQLVKNLTGDNKVSPKRKFEEILRSTNLEKKLGKNEILELYLNVVYLSQNCYGVSAGAQMYFDKEAEDLTIAECAALSAIVKNPYKYDPYRFPENNEERRKIVLKKLLQYEKITEEQYEEAINEKLVLSTTIEDKRTSGIYSWYTEALIDDVAKDLSVEYGINKKTAVMMILKGGMNIYSLIDPELQRKAEFVFENYTAYVPSNGGRYPQSSCVIIDPKTNDILAIIGGSGGKNANRILNRATETKRAPGSVIKPLSVYAPAIEKGLICYSSVYEDLPIDLSKDKCWPRNAPDVYRGLVTVNYSIVHSLNTVAVRVLSDLGAETSFDYLTNRFLLTPDCEKDKNASSLALGQLTNGESLLSITNSFTPFDNGGTISNPKTYLYVTDNYGNVILNKESERKNVISDDTASIMTIMLHNVTTEGTAKGMNVTRKVSVAGKTGTSSNNSDKWFVGFTPDYVCGVWTGFDNPEPMNFRNPSIRLFDALMSMIYKSGEEYKDFDISSNIVSAEYCEDSGKIPCELCENDQRGTRIRTGYYIKGTEPKEICDIHKEFNVDKDNNLIEKNHGSFFSKKIVLLDYERKECYSQIDIADAEYLVCSKKKSLRMK